MDNNTGYTGKVYFFKNVKYDYIVSVHGDAEYYFKCSEHVLVGETEIIRVDFITDTREAEIEAIESEMAKKKIEHHVWLDTMSGKIQSLRAIEATE